MRSKDEALAWYRVGVMQTRGHRPAHASSGLDDVDETNAFIGRVLENRYRLEAVLGEGGMGVVYRAQHLKLGRPVAIKLLQTEYALNDLLRQRFEREAKTLAAMSHPHIVAVTDYGFADGVPYLVMELVQGETLRERLEATSRLTPIQALAITEQLLQALAYAHREGLIHRDLKPANLALQVVEGAGDQLRVLDFGLAKFLNPDPRSSSSVVLTKTGVVMGTPAYMAPEQSVGGETDARTDVYAVGVILYEMLTGQRPFDGEPTDLLRKALLEPVPLIEVTRPELGRVPELDVLVQKATAKDPGDRFADASEMLAALKRVPRALLSTSIRPMPTSAVAASGWKARLKAYVSRMLSRPIFWIGTAFVVFAVALFLLAREPAPDASIPVSASSGPSDDGERAVGRADPSPALQPASSPALAATPKADTPAVTGSPGPTGQLADPWSRPAPKLLRQVKRALDQGKSINKRSDQPLRRVGLRSRDGRAYVLLGRAYMVRGWRSDAVEAFEQAVQIEPGVRADRHMLSVLLELVADNKVTAKSAAAIRSIYGKEAIAAVESRLSRPGLSEDEKRRYAQLLAHLRASP